MLVSDWTKLVTLVLVAVGAIFLGYFGKLSTEAVASLLAACLGYVFGNGHGVAEARRLYQQQQSQANGNGGSGNGN